MGDGVCKDDCYNESCGFDWEDCEEVVRVGASEQYRVLDEALLHSFVKATGVVIIVDPVVELR